MPLCPGHYRGFMLAMLSRPVREGGAVAGSVGASLKRYRRLSSHSSPNGFPSGPQPAILLALRFVLSCACCHHQGCSAH